MVSTVSLIAGMAILKPKVNRYISKLLSLLTLFLLSSRFITVTRLTFSSSSS